MDKNFAQALRWLAAHEGGLTNLKNDPGGLTNLGVTQADYDHYRRFKRLPLRSVSAITPEEAADDFKQFYWNTLQCDKLASGVDNCIFDMGVNNGVTGAAKCAQLVVNSCGLSSVVVDGHIGPVTLDAIDDIDPTLFIDSFCDLRLKTDSGFLNWKTFGRAWTNRVNGNTKLGIAPVRGQSKSLIDPPILPAAVKAVMPTQAVSTNYIVDALEAAISFVAKLFHRA